MHKSLIVSNKQESKEKSQKSVDSLPLTRIITTQLVAI